MTNPDPPKHISWILVTGASDSLTEDEVDVAKEVGAMLAREGYGLIVGDWHGVDWLVRAEFLEGVPCDERATRIKHVANFVNLGFNLVRVPGAEVLKDDGEDKRYSLSAILAANAGIIVSGRKGSKPSMYALLRHQKPVLPIPFLGYDAFEIYRDVLDNWNEVPVRGLTERQFLELMKPWRHNPRTLARMLHAALVTTPEIFVSYRRNDVPAAAGRIYDELAHAYGQSAVFIDYANLVVGEAIERTVAQVHRSKVLVAIIGPNWDAGRLRNDGDYVRRELEAAKAAELTIIAILVDGAVLPAIDMLPESLKFVWGSKFAFVTIDHWQQSVEEIKKALDGTVIS